MGRDKKFKEGVRFNGMMEKALGESLEEIARREGLNSNEVFNDAFKEYSTRHSKSLNNQLTLDKVLEDESNFAVPYFFDAQEKWYTFLDTLDKDQLIKAIVRVNLIRKQLTNIRGIKGW